MSERLSAPVIDKGVLSIAFLFELGAIPHDESSFSFVTELDVILKRIPLRLHEGCNAEAIAHDFSLCLYLAQMNVDEDGDEWKCTFPVIQTYLFLLTKDYDLSQQAFYHLKENWRI